MRDHQPIDLDELRAGLKGTRYRDLVQHHRAMQSQRELVRAADETIGLFPQAEQEVVEALVRRWLRDGPDRDFWEQDTSEIMDALIKDGRDTLKVFGIELDDESAFNLFLAVTLSWAIKVNDSPQLRALFRELRGGFPWESAIGLLYPIAAAIHVSLESPQNAATIAGYGITNLAYLLVLAGIIGGTFRAFGLIKRWQVFAAATLAFTVGVVLTNIGS